MAPAYAATLSGKYPAKAHFQRVVKELHNSGASPGNGGIIYVEGAKSVSWPDCDQEMPFRQIRNFFYLSGCNLPGCAVAFGIESGKSTLFIPPVNPSEVIWSGLPLSVEDAKKKYDFDNVMTTDQVESFLNDMHDGRGPMYSLDKSIYDKIERPHWLKKDIAKLKDAIDECRVVKDDYEVALSRKANDVSALAHKAVFKAAKTAKNEAELYGIFLKTCIANGCQNQAYSPIVASGTDSATLHYVNNDKDITSSQLNLLLDASCEADCYASDITRTFPINGKFTPESASIYRIVLKMQKSCLDRLKAGVEWADIHVLAHEIAIEGLIELGILKGDAGEVFKSGVSTVFFPHGLGHFLGMDTHDSGGRPNYKDENPMFRYLRVRRGLPAGSIITVEPGIYFCKFMIEPALKKPEYSKYIVPSVLDKYWDVGGVRIEDDILITEKGYDNLTTVPKELEELEALISG